MPYPDSPFEENFNSKLIIGLHEEESCIAILNEQYVKTLKWLCSSPKITSYRVNTLKNKREVVLEKIKEHICERYSARLEIHPLIPNVVVIHHDSSKKGMPLEKHHKEIIIDVDCAAAILRGAHIYAPGVLAMMSGTQKGDKVSIYADTKKKCKKGLQKLYEDDSKIFIGNGEAKMIRFELFGENLTPSGVAVQVRDTISGCPSLGDNFLPTGCALLQNLPSILCVYALNPQPHERILDMCASPGNKTTHIAELMMNKGVLVAIDKTMKKTTQLKKRCAEFGAKVHVFAADSTKIADLDRAVIKLPEEGPPFSAETFDRILLDAPCSVLGKRPQMANRMSEKEIRSYVPLQRKLFETIFTYNMMCYKRHWLMFIILIILLGFGVSKTCGSDQCPLNVTEKLKHCPGKTSPCNGHNQVIRKGGYYHCCNVCYTLLQKGEECENPKVPNAICADEFLCINNKCQ